MTDSKLGYPIQPPDPYCILTSFWDSNLYVELTYLLNWFADEWHKQSTSGTQMSELPVSKTISKAYGGVPRCSIPKY